MSQYVTIIRTRFENFEDPEECDKDREILSESISEELGEVINRIVHVDNPQIHLTSEGKRVERQKELNIEIRKASRGKLLKHLVAYESIYKPSNLDILNKIVGEEWKDKEILKLKITKKFIQHIREKNSGLGEEVKEELEKIRNKVEKRLIHLEKGELDKKTSSQDCQSISKQKKKEDNDSVEERRGQREEFQTKTNLQSELSKQIEGQLVRELRELNSYLLEGEKGKRLVDEIVIGREEIIRVLKGDIEEKKEHLQEVKDSLEKKLSNVRDSVSRFFGGGKQEKNLVQEICQAQIDLDKSETELENIQKILGRIENFKEQLEQQLETRVEVFLK
ncbi:8974_t:CDS:2 [Paraglomus occultum]|uniref:8974_t:CDS:1 n=1 Tax=Paraglomus occultum TaxID=144539 RepID=A0A9N9G7B9_9GLOM|nr:8974_t:CDS:2 [Paraglomus occultum]